jgi:hypothetical protein
MACLGSRSGVAASPGQVRQNAAHDSRSQLMRTTPKTWSIAQLLADKVLYGKPRQRLRNKATWKKKPMDKKNFSLSPINLIIRVPVAFFA